MPILKSFYYFYHTLNNASILFSHIFSSCKSTRNSTRSMQRKLCREESIFRRQSSRAWHPLKSQSTRVCNAYKLNSQIQFPSRSVDKRSRYPNVSLRDREAQLDNLIHSTKTPVFVSFKNSVLPPNIRPASSILFSSTYSPRFHIALSESRTGALRNDKTMAMTCESELGERRARDASFEMINRRPVSSLRLTGSGGVSSLST